MTRRTLVKESRVAAPTATVWAGFTTAEGLNTELMPMLRLTPPHRSEGPATDPVGGGMPLGRSRLLLFGLIPLGHIELRLTELELGRRFVERSAMLAMREWQHERVLEAVDEGCLVRDTVTFEVREPLARIPGVQRAVGGLLRGLFNHRHRRLTLRHGATEPAAPGS